MKIKPGCLTQTGEPRTVDCAGVEASRGFAREKYTRFASPIVYRLGKDIIFSSAAGEKHGQKSCLEIAPIRTGILFDLLKCSCNEF